MQHVQIVIIMQIKMNLCHKNVAILVVVQHLDIGGYKLKIY
jgi:hypothetical protein